MQKMRKMRKTQKRQKKNNMTGYENFAFFYDRLTENINYKAIADNLCSLLSEAGAEKGILLDLACGTGTVSFLMQKAGWDVIGVDSSADMLSVARQKNEALGSGVMFINQKMQELDLYGTVDAAVCVLDSINHLTDPDDVLETFRRVRLFLNSGGVFVFDVNTPYKHKHVLKNNTFVYDLDDLYCVWQNFFNKKDCSTDIELDFFVRDKDKYTRCTDGFTERGYELEALEQMLYKAGFESVTINRPDKERAIFVVR